MIISATLTEAFLSCTFAALNYSIFAYTPLFLLSFVTDSPRGHLSLFVKAFGGWNLGFAFIKTLKGNVRIH